VYTTLSGTVGMLVPFTSREDHDFFQNLEMHMRAENPPMAGRDHLAFRSYYFPVGGPSIPRLYSCNASVVVG
jgi:splicing factor 3B subunit 3